MNSRGGSSYETIELWRHPAM